jgi:hypothetical protein
MVPYSQTVSNCRKAETIDRISPFWKFLVRPFDSIDGINKFANSLRMVEICEKSISWPISYYDVCRNRIIAVHIHFSGNNVLPSKYKNQHHNKYFNMNPIKTGLLFMIFCFTKIVQAKAYKPDNFCLISID